MRDLARRVAFLGFLAAGSMPVLGGDVAGTLSYLYTLSDFSGPVPYNDVKLHADRANDEVYAILGGAVRVFNASGMEVYRFDVDPAVGTVFDLAVEESGDLLLLGLSMDPSRSGPGWSISRCDYRGQPIGRLAVTGLPPEFDRFRPNVMQYQGGRIVLASLSQHQVAVIDRTGAFLKAFDLARTLGMKDSDRSKNDLAAFSLDRRGNMLVTIPTMFKAFVISPEGKVLEVGHPGSSPGAFGIVAGVVGDEDGNLVVADKGRGVVIVFDSQLDFVSEFGSGAGLPRGLVRPTDLALGRSGKLYVTQARDRGVAVLQVNQSGRRTGAAAGKEGDGAATPMRPPS